MSLFDLDDDGSSSVSSEDKAPMTSTAASGAAGTPTPPALTADEIRARMGLPGRYTVTAGDAARSAAQQREALERRLGGRGAVASSAGPADTGSKFGNSIAAALQLRKEDQAQLLIDRVRKQREQDANTPELIEKDMDVGIFVTPAYKQMLKTHYKSAAQKTRRSALATAEASSGSEETDEEAHGSDSDAEDALDAYLKQFARPSSASADHASMTSAGVDFYTASMRQAVRDDAVREPAHEQASPLEQDGAVDNPSSGQADTALAPPSLDELQSLLGLPSLSPSSALPPATDALRPSTTAVVGESAPAAADGEERAHAEVVSNAGDATRAHLTAVFHAREARKRKRADDAFITGCAQRCDARILRSIRA